MSTNEFNPWGFVNPFQTVANPFQSPSGDSINQSSQSSNIMSYYNYYPYYHIRAMALYLAIMDGQKDDVIKRAREYESFLSGVNPEKPEKTKK